MKQPDLTRRSAPLFIALVLLCSFGVSSLLHLANEATAPVDPEPARFMLECVSDFRYDPDTCRAILAGGDPPLVPDGEPGC